MLVALNSETSLATLRQFDEIGIQLYFDETSYKAMFEALNRVISSKNNRLATLRNIINGVQKAEFKDIYPIRYPWLNNSQQNAINNVLACKM